MDGQAWDSEKELQNMSPANKRTDAIIILN